jgi:hypothetical protein
MLLAPVKGWKKRVGKPHKNSTKPEAKHAFAVHSAGAASTLGQIVIDRAQLNGGTSGPLTKHSLAT